MWRRGKEKFPSACHAHSATWRESGFISTITRTTERLEMHDAMWEGQAVPCWWSRTVLCYHLTPQIDFRELLWPSSYCHKHHGTRLSYIKYNPTALGNKEILTIFHHVKQIFRVVLFLTWSPEIPHLATQCFAHTKGEMTEGIFLSRSCCPALPLGLPSVTTAPSCPAWLQHNEGTSTTFFSIPCFLGCILVLNHDVNILLLSSQQCFSGQASVSDTRYLVITAELFHQVICIH